MKFGKYLEANLREEWYSQYVDYGGLKDLIKRASRSTDGIDPQPQSPRTTSLSVSRNGDHDSLHERFFALLNSEVDKIGKFTQRRVDELRQALGRLEAKVDTRHNANEKQEAAMVLEAKRIGNEFLALEKYVNLNYMGFHKILKKHDKKIPQTPCRTFYLSHLHHQPWVRGNYSNVLVTLSNIHSKLRRDKSGERNEDAAQGFVRTTTKYWVRSEDVSTVKHAVLQHLPVFQFCEEDCAGDAQLTNSVYLDNSILELYHGRLDKRPNALAVRLRWYGPHQPPNVVFVERKTHQESWKGEESMKERCMLREDTVVPFLEGEYTPGDAAQDLRAQNKPEEEIESFQALFEQLQQQVDSKQLRPLIRTQYMRTAFQIPFDASVRISLDTNLVMLKENPDGGPSTSLMGRWCRDPSLPIQRTEITRFPHAVLEVKLSLQEGDPTPAWVQELINSDLCTEVHKFSKFIHGTATLFPDMVQAVPYWVDDESVRPSMLMSAPSYRESEEEVELPPSTLDLEGDGPEMERQTPRTPRDAQRDTPRNAVPRLRLPRLDELRHPLLADEPSISLIGDANDGGQSARSMGNGLPSARSMNNGLPSARSMGTGGVSSARHSGMVSARSQESGHGFLTRLLGLDKPKKAVLRRPAMRVEPKTFFANERTFLAWLNMAITVGSIAIALLGFGGTASRNPGQLVVMEVVEINALILLPLALVMSCYAMVMFLWRASRIARLKVTYFDDRVGPLGLSIVTGACLLTIFGIGLYDYIQDLRGALAN